MGSVKTPSFPTMQEISAASRGPLIHLAKLVIGPHRSVYYTLMDLRGNNERRFEMPWQEYLKLQIWHRLSHPTPNPRLP